MSARDDAALILALVIEPVSAPGAMTAADTTTATDVAALLSASRAAHLLYRQHCGRFHPQAHQVMPGDPAASRAALLEAARFRAQAEVVDPTHADPAWNDEVGTNFEHDPLLAFYKAQLSH